MNSGGTTTDWSRTDFSNDSADDWEPAARFAAESASEETTKNKEDEGHDGDQGQQDQGDSTTAEVIK